MPVCNITEVSTNVLYGWGTVDKNVSGQLADAACLCALWTRVCTHQMAALFCAKWRHGIGRHVESVTSNRKSDSVNRCVFTWGTILPNFVPIRF